MNQIEQVKNELKFLMCFYFKGIAQRSGYKWGTEHTCEIHAIVDYMDRLVKLRLQDMLLNNKKARSSFKENN